METGGQNYRTRCSETSGQTKPTRVMFYLSARNTTASQKGSLATGHLWYSGYTHRGPPHTYLKGSTMSEQTAVEATTAPVTPSDPMVAMVQQTVSSQIEQANSLVRTINANTTDKGKLVHDIRTDESVSDETVKAFQEWFAKAEAEIERRVTAVDDYIKANLLPATEAVDVDALKAQHKSLKDSIKAALTFVQTVPGYKAEEFSVPDLANLRGGTSAGTGTGGKRPRLNRIWVNGDLISKTVTDAKTKDEVEVSNFTLAAAAIGKLAKTKVEVKDLQQAAFGAAGTDDLSTLNGRVFEYNFEAGEGENRKNVTVKVEPKNTSGETEAADETPAETPAE